MSVSSDESTENDSSSILCNKTPTVEDEVRRASKGRTCFATRLPSSSRSHVVMWGERIRRGHTKETYDDLTRRPVFCLLAGRRAVGGVQARDPTDELPSPVAGKAIGESCLSAS